MKINPQRDHRQVFFAFPPKAQNQVIKAGLLAHLTFARLLAPAPFGFGQWPCGAKEFSFYAKRTDLQLRGQLRFSTGFPFNP